MSFRRMLHTRLVLRVTQAMACLMQYVKVGQPLFVITTHGVVTVIQVRWETLRATEAHQGTEAHLAMARPVREAQVLAPRD